MKLLIKIYLDDLNPYDQMSLITDLNNNIEDKENTKIHITTNKEFDYKICDSSYYKESTIPKMINYNLDNLKWDIILPFFRTCITTQKGFDNIIREKYKQLFSNKDGILWLNDSFQKEYNTFPVIGINYYKKFGYIYNPVYKKSKFEKEFTDVMKIIDKYHFVEDVFFKVINFKSDDDNIYELRKRFNFNLIKDWSIK